MGKAIEQQDFLASFRKYVDVEGITSSLIDQMLELSTESREQQGEWEQLGEAIGKGLNNAPKTAINQNCRTVNRKICQNLSSRGRKRVISLKNLKFRYQISGINLVEKKEMERLEGNEKQR